MRSLAAVLALTLITAACGSSSEDRIVIAAGTTLVDSGLLDQVAERYESENAGVQLSIVGEATAQVIELGLNGAADLLLTHAPDAERTFIKGGHSASDALVLESAFVLLGPAGLAAQFDSHRVADAFTGIAADRLTFVSRADGSGTFARELEIWAASGAAREGEWLVETGQSMGLTLQVADQRDAFVLAEVGTYLTAAPLIGLRPVALAAGPELVNPYRAMVVAGGSEVAASRFLEWLVSPAGVDAITDANLALFGDVVYAPLQRG